MRRIAAALLCLALSAAGCKEAPQPVEVDVDYVPVTAKDFDVKVVKPGSDQLEALDARTAKDVHQALNTLMKAPGEQASAADLAAAKDPAKLLGAWQIVHTLHSTNGEVSQPSPPIVPTTWTLDKDGSLTINGGMKINARFTYTGDQLLISGFGPKQTYEIKKLTDTDLEVTVKIGAGTTNIENTTVLKRR